MLCQRLVEFCLFLHFIKMGSDFACSAFKKCNIPGLRCIRFYAVAFWFPRLWGARVSAQLASDLGCALPPVAPAVAVRLGGRGCSRHCSSVRGTQTWLFIRSRFWGFVHCWSYTSWVEPEFKRSSKILYYGLALMETPVNACCLFRKEWEQSSVTYGKIGLNKSKRFKNNTQFRVLSIRKHCVIG